MKKNFNQLAALAGISMAGALGALGIGEVQDHLYRQDRIECHKNTTEKAELTSCLNDYDPDTQKKVQETYGHIVIGLGVLGLFLGGKAYGANRAQVREDQRLKEEYRKAEGLDGLI